MAESANPLTPLEIYRVLEKSNCRRCMLPSCLAFAAAVIGGQKKLTDCPSLQKADRDRLQERLEPRSTAEPRQAEFLERLMEKVGSLDFNKVAAERGARVNGDLLTIRSLGKEFHIDHQGQMSSECHIISWVQAPILSYVCHPTHHQITGDWIAFRELKGGIDWQNLFSSRCETPLRELADNHTDLFSDLIDLFLGQQVEDFEADIGLVLHPLPHVPILICYQAADADLDSELTIFFDACCATNLHIKSLYTLCAGLVMMFSEIAKKHV
ncbi:MAG: DUF3786 domain-containing protein [Thermodesulfobacteriota bacterium]